jgi:hypothetical protein
VKDSAKPIATKRRTVFLWLLAIVMGGYLFAGFARTFFLKPLFATQPLTIPLIVHGICGTAWIALLIWQAYLVRSGQTARHRIVGRRFGRPIAVIAILSAIAIAWLSGFDGVVTGSGLPDSTALFIQIGTMAWFSVLATLGFRSTARPEYHKRYMIMASIAMLAPAYSRLARLLVEGRPPADSAFLAVPLIAALFVFDFRTRHAPHPVTLWAGLGYLAYVSVRLPIARSDWWNHTMVPLLFGS